MDITCKKSKTKISFFLFSTLFLTFFVFTSVFSQPDGAKVFKANCASCHSITDKVVIGPGLKGVESRWASKELMHKWIKNSIEVVKSGDPYAVKISQFSASVMTPQTVNDEEIDAIMKYINEENAKVKVLPPGEGEGNKGGGEIKGDSTLMYVVIVIGVFLIILINVLKGVKRSLQNMVNEKKGLPLVVERAPVEALGYWLTHNKKTVAVLLVIFVVWMSKVGWDAAAKIGVYTGYEPEQPIHFSHKIHAGENGISCNYCHLGVEKSRHANIPSLNLCMNCHNYIEEGATTGTTEISKIYAALDYDKKTKTYGDNPKPIKWVRVHSLPEHVYFNHSQHVKVGGVECATCHGPVETMSIVRQEHELTMGWCINCHRETEVKMDNNPYYEQLHATLKEKYKGQKITVDKMGGIECARCHY